MVNLVKARQKAKKGAAVGAEDRVATHERLENFKAEAGKKRAVVEAAVEISADSLDLLTFLLGGERYAIDVERVMEIAMPHALTRVPNADPFVLGVISLRGIVVTIVDVRQRLRHGRDREGEQVIVVTDAGGPVGFDVDRVLRPTSIGRDALEAHPVVHASEERPAIRGVFREQNALTILLDLDKLLH